MKLIPIGNDGHPNTAVALLDEKTGLMWAAANVPGEFNWKDAQRVAAEQRVAGFEDWRLPTIEELESLRDRTRCDPAADPVLGLSTDLWYWSSTPSSSSPSDSAWFVHFGYGFAYYESQDYSAFVRPVRSARASQ